jgi:hypothetical protein
MVAPVDGTITNVTVDNDDTGWLTTLGAPGRNRTCDQAIRRRRPDTYVLSPGSLDLAGLSLSRPVERNYLLTDRRPRPPSQIRVGGARPFAALAELRHRAMHPGSPTSGQRRKLYFTSRYRKWFGEITPAPVRQYT